MGNLLGHGVRFGAAGPVMIFGEGVETMLSLRMVLPRMPMIAGLSANHLAALHFPAALRRLYVAREDDPAGRAAWAALNERALPLGIAVHPLEPQRDDLNTDLRRFGPTRLMENLRPQLTPVDAERFLGP
jgi:hypothetical protein